MVWDEGPYIAIVIALDQGPIVAIIKLRDRGLYTAITVVYEGLYLSILMVLDWARYPYITADFCQTPL